MKNDNQYEVLRAQYLRLRAAAEAVIDAADYPADDDNEARIYRSQLRALEREIRGEPQPHGLSFMSVS